MYEIYKPVQTNTFGRTLLSWYSRPGQSQDCFAGHRQHPGQLEPSSSAPGDSWPEKTGGANAGIPPPDFYFLANYQMVPWLMVKTKTKTT